MRIPKFRRRPNTQMRGRIAVLIICLSCVGFLAVAVRLFWMQVVRYDYYQDKALNFQTRDDIIEPKRGTIYDRNMKVLAESAATESVMFNPNGLAQWVDTKNKKVQDGGTKLSLELIQEQAAKILSDNLSLDYDSVLEKVQRTDRKSVKIQGQVEKDIVNKIYEDMKAAGIQTGSSNSVYTTPDTKRYYPYSSFASQVIGFLNAGGAVGGIELEYDEVLSGTAGRIVRAQNAQNSDMPYEYEQYIPAEDGASVVTTLDETVQHYLETHLETGLADNPQARGGVSGIVMDVKTGEILAMANMPDFDVNAYSTIEKDSLYYNELLTEIQEYFTENGLNGTVTDEYLCEGLWAGLPNGLSDDQKTEIDKLRTEKLQTMWRNHIVSDTYEPGSTFKLMTVATALESGAISEDDTFFCGGVMHFQDWDIHCHNTSGHGQQTLTEALMNSCNVAMMQIAAQTGPETFREYMEAFGLTEKTGIDLPGEANNASLVFTAEDMTTRPTDLAVSSFGQRFQVTPLQMITMVSAIVDDGSLKTPHIVKQVLNADGTVRETTNTEVKRQVVSNETSQFMRDAMEAVVSEGTGKNAYVAGYRVGGKTATSEIQGQPDDEEKRYTASFIGVAPMDDPQIAVLVAIQDLPESAPHGGGAIAAPIVGRILSDVLPYLGVEQVYDDSEEDRREVEVPSLIGQTEDAATKSLTDAGFRCKIVGDGDKVTDQVPSGGVKIPIDSEVILYMGGEKPTEMIEVPNVLGEHPSTAKDRLENVHLYMRRTGIKTSQTNSGTVAVQQNPAAGTSVPIGTVITVSFENSTGVSDR
ncbi:MAG: penicillin-binding transpeptidase domain-containing protein [Butyricicoccus sp.]|nr:penicillin-binding transpeptidase domain-containing protein [Butyricicoccus sp.]